MLGGVLRAHVSRYFLLIFPVDLNAHLETLVMRVVENNFTVCDFSHYSSHVLVQRHGSRRRQNNDRCPRSEAPDHVDVGNRMNPSVGCGLMVIESPSAAETGLLVLSSCPNAISLSLTFAAS